MKYQNDSLRKSFDLSIYFIVGSENVKNKSSFGDVIRQAIKGGVTFMQIRSKTASTSELMELGHIAAGEIELAGKQDKIALVINDRVDIALALRLKGVKVDGVHLGQSDLPADLARKILGENAIIGLSAKSKDLFEYAKSIKPGIVDYLGAGPLRASKTKPDCGMVDGIVLERTFDEIRHLKEVSQLPVVVGGGIKPQDLPALKDTGIDGFFVVSAIADAENIFEATQLLVKIWANS